MISDGTINDFDRFINGTFLIYPTTFVSVLSYSGSRFTFLNLQARDALNGASATGGESSAARAFLSSGKREVSREYPSFAAGLHNLPPTPASPFPHATNNPFNAASKGKSMFTLVFTFLIVSF